MTNAEKLEIKAFVKDYIELCRKHKKFICVDVNEYGMFEQMGLMKIGNDEQDFFEELLEIQEVFEMSAETLKGEIDG